MRMRLMSLCSTNDLAFHRNPCFSSAILEYNSSMPAELIVAGIAATMQAVQTWYQVRDSRKASAELQERESRTREPEIEQAAKTLTSVVPQSVLDSIQARLNKCWSGYQKVLDNPDEYTPDETSDATKAVIKCVCREITRVRDLTRGDIPAGPMTDFANKHDCNG